MNTNMARFINYIYFILTAALSIAFLLNEDYTFLFNSFLMTLFYIGVITLERYSSFKLANFIRMLIILTLFGHNFLGEYLKLYAANNIFDKGLHFFGSFAFALFAYNLIISFIKIRSSNPRILAFIIVTSIGIFLGVVWEIVEFGFDMIGGQNNQSGFIDTNLDLLADLLGSTLAALLVIAYPPSKDLMMN